MQNQKITPFLWYDDNAEEAVNLYVSIFKNSGINNVSRYGAAGPGAPGTVMTIDFELEGQRFIALNGGPHYRFTEAVSLFVDCQTQEEVDEITEKLLAGGGEQGPCAWLKDKFGLSWQIVPSILPQLLTDSDPVKSTRAMEAMLKMTKIDIAGLEKAYQGK
jgi:predicted 3-demethylubiquinone-9 3-methyltransferase (glyoxalase superfamily)